LSHNLFWTGCVIALWGKEEIKTTANPPSNKTQFRRTKCFGGLGELLSPKPSEEGQNCPDRHGTGGKRGGVGTKKDEGCGIFLKGGGDKKTTEKAEGVFATGSNLD